MARQTPLGAINDDAEYLLLARSIWHGAYMLPDGLGVPATNPLPMFPLLMALPVRMFGAHWGWFKLLALGWSWLTLALAARLFTRRLSRDWSLAALALTAFNPVFAAHAGIATADIPFLSLSLLGIEALSRGSWPLAALASAAASLTRPQGLVLAAALALAIAHRDGPRKAAAFAAAALAPIGLWLLRNLRETTTPSDYVAHLRSQVSGDWSWIDQLREGGRLCALLFGRGFLGLEDRGVLPVCAGALVVAAAGAGALRLIRRGDVAAFAMAAYCSLVLCLHLMWQQVMDRYLLALLPFIVFFVSVEVGSRFSRRVSVVVGALLAASLIRADLAALAPPAGATGILWPETVAWIRDRTPPEARLQSAAAPALMLLTDRQTIPFFSHTPFRDEWLAICLSRGIGYVVVDLNASRWTHLPEGWKAKLGEYRSWLSASPYIRLAFRAPHEKTEVFEISHPDRGRFLRAWGLYAGTFGAIRDPARSRKDLKEAVRLEPELACAWAELARRETGEDAVRDRARALRADPSWRPLFP